MSQTALLVTAIGQPLVKTTTHPGPNQIQVKVTVAGLNPHDQKARDTGLFIADHLPAILGNDVVGTITQLGTGVTRYIIGDRVLGHADLATNLQRGLQQYTILDIPYTTKIPDKISDDEAATLPTNIIAPLVALFDTDKGLGLPAPWTPEAKGFEYNKLTLLVVGGGSSCGKFGVQLAKLVGMGRIVVVGSKRSEAEVRSYGATEVIYRDSDDVLGQIRALVGDDLVYAYDAVNRPDGQVLAIDALSNTKKGTLARLVPRPVDGSKVKAGKKEGYVLKNVFGISHVVGELAAPFWERVPGWLEGGQIRPLGWQVVEGLDADRVNGLLDRMRDGEAVEKIHVHP